MAQWWRSCWWKKPGVQAACTDRSRVPDTRRVPVRSRGSKTFVQIEAGGFYPRFYGMSILENGTRQTQFLSKTNRQLYVLYRMATLPMTLSDPALTTPNHCLEFLLFAPLSQSSLIGFESEISNLVHCIG